MTAAEIGFRALLAEYGETVVYVTAAGVERPITAIVRRPAASPVPPTNAWSGSAMTVAAINDETEGISADDLDEGLDNLKVARMPGGTPESRPIGRIVAVDDTMIQLEIR